MISNNLTLLSESFPSENGGQPATGLGNRNRCAVPGTLFNTNTLEGFYGLDKQSLLKAEAKKVWDDICCGAVEKDCSLLSRYLLISFADLKNWRFHYWFASPALVLDPPARLPTLTPASKWFSVEQVLILLYVRYPCKVLDPKHAEKVTHSDPLLSLGNL